MHSTTQDSSLAAVALLTLCFAFAGCESVNSVSPPPPTPPPPNNRAPELVSLSPSSAIVGGGGFTLTVNGSNFAASAVIQWNGQPVPTTFVSSQQVTAAISSSLVASGGSDSVSAQNANSSESNALLFSVNYPIPQITSTLPNSVIAGAATLPLTVNGSNFIDGISGVFLNGISQLTIWLSPTELQTTIPASYMAAPGPINVSVEDLPEDYAQPVATSNVATVTVTPLISNPVPTLDSSLDTSVPVGWPGFELTVNGANFVAGSVLQWNGIDRQTMVTSSTQLRAAIPADQLVSLGAAQVSVFNPSPGGGTSSSLPVQVVPPGAIGVIDRANIRNDLFEPDDGGDSSKVSGDGRFVAFRSNATDLAPGNFGFATDVYLRDTCIGAPTGCVPSVTSLPLASGWIAISANGRFVGAMVNQAASNLSLFLYDTCFGAPAGCVPAALPITAVPNTYKTGISLSADGRFAVFLSGQFDCGADDDCNANPPQVQVFLTDTCAGVSSGCTPSSQAISQVTAGIENPSISRDGRFVAFNSSDQDVSLIDTCQGGPANCSPSTTLVSATSNGGPADAESFGGTPSDGGRYVTFLSLATNLVPGPLSAGVTRVYLRDMCTGAPPGCTPTTTLVAVAGDDTFTDAPTISADGRYIAFSSTAPDLVPGDTNGAQDIFVYDTCAGVSSGCAPSTVQVSVALDGTQGTDGSVRPTISADGRFVVFDSLAKLAPGASTPPLNIYLARH
jgi:trimeric autotransporter adhesin